MDSGGRGEEYLVESNNDGHARSLGVTDGFNALRSHTVVCSHHDDGNVCDLGTSRAHRTEGLQPAICSFQKLEELD